MPDIRRSQSIFDPKKHEMPVLIAGCGATGSHIALQLACLGVQHLTVVDFDTVAEHNLTNQAYFFGQTGMPKVEALKEMLFHKFHGDDGPAPADSDYPICINGRLPEAFDDVTTDRNARMNKKRPVIFLCVDSMDARREIVDALYRHAKNGIPTDWYVIDTRMAATHGNIYGFSIFDKERWEATLIDDDQAEMSPCGTAITVIPTVFLTSALAVCEYIKLCTDEFAIEEKIDFFWKPLSVNCDKM